MSEHKKGHIATVLTLLLFAVIIAAMYAPAFVIVVLVVLAAVSLPIVVWNIIRESF